jgi:hypothetical protein
VNTQLPRIRADHGFGLPHLVVEGTAARGDGQPRHWMWVLTMRRNQWLTSWVKCCGLMYEQHSTQYEAHLVSVGLLAPLGIARQSPPVNHVASARRTP